jgi:hypothetical protein
VTAPPPGPCTCPDLGEGRNRFRIQGGIVPGDYDTYPVLSLNYQHRFVGFDSVVRTGGIIELGTFWIAPYAEAGVSFGSRVASGRLGAGVVLVPIYGIIPVPYMSAAFSVSPVRSPSLDLEIEGRFLHAFEAGGGFMLVAGLAFH